MNHGETNKKTIDPLVLLLAITLNASHIIPFWVTASEINLNLEIITWPSIEIFHHEAITFLSKTESLFHNSSAIVDLMSQGGIACAQLDQVW